MNLNPKYQDSLNWANTNYKEGVGFNTQAPGYYSYISNIETIILTQLHNIHPKIDLSKVSLNNIITNAIPLLNAKTWKEFDSIYSNTLIKH